MKTHHIIKAIGLFAMLILAILAGKPLAAQNPGSFTQSDRELLIRLEEKFESLQKQIDLTNKRIDELKTDVNNRFDKQKLEFDQKFDDLQTFMYWGFGILFTMMMVLMGFVLWDRRTAIKPIENRTHQLEEALIEYAKTDPKLKEILRKAAIY
jgi:predicted PurR-regulated permease PerM